MPAKSGIGWNVRYLTQPNAESWLQSHVLVGSFPSTGHQPRLDMKVFRRTVLNPGEWVHLAYVWGRSAENGNLLASALYINGRRGTDRVSRFDNEASEPPLRLLLPGSMEGAVDELRISRSQRYTRDFDPPSRNRALELDADTLALFHFNGNTEGEAFGGTHIQSATFQ
jgi:hypothetical protein